MPIGVFRCYIGLIGQPESGLPDRSPDQGQLGIIESGGQGAEEANPGWPDWGRLGKSGPIGAGGGQSVTAPAPGFRR